jgi:molybdopterin biosynthesis enzyme
MFEPLTDEQIENLKAKGWRVGFKDFGWLTVPPGTNVALDGYATDERQAWQHAHFIDTHPPLPIPEWMKRDEI